MPTYSSSGGAIIPTSTSVYDPTSGVTSAPQTIGAADLNTTQQPYTVPSTPADPTGGYLAQLGSLDSIFSQVNQPTDTEKAQTDTSSTYKLLLNKLLGRNTSIGTDGKIDTTAPEKEARDKYATEQGYAGYGDIRAKLRSVSDQIKALQLEGAGLATYDATKDPSLIGRGVTVGGSAPLQAQNTEAIRQNTIKALGLAARAAIYQGDVSNAEEYAKSAVEAEFAPLQMQANFLQSMYTMNKDQLDREDRKRSERLGYMIEERRRVLDEARKDKEFTFNTALKAAEYGAPPEVVEQMKNTTPTEAIKLGTKYLGAEFQRKLQQQAFENNIALRQVAVSEGNLALARRKQLIEQATAGDKEAIRQLGYDPNNLPANALKREEQKITMERDISIAKRARENGVGLQSSSGLVRGGWLGVALESPGGILGAPYAAAKKNDFLADAGYIVKNMTFNKIRELADMGVKLTPISEKELKAMADASSVLAASAQYDDNGNLTGFKMSEERVRQQLQLVQDHYQRGLDQLLVDTLLSEEEFDEI